MKKLTALILTLVMLLSMTAIVHVSAESNTFAVTPLTDDFKVEAGEQFTIKWNLNDDCNFYNATFTIKYDPNAFTFKARSQKAFDSQLTDYVTVQANNNASVGELYILLKSTYGDLAAILAEDGVEMPETFFAATFTAKSDIADGKYAFGFETTDSTNFDGEKVTLPAVDDINVQVGEDVVVPTFAIAVDGVQLREPLANGVEPAFGARFVSTADYVEGYEYGTVVIPTDLLDGELTVATANAAVIPASTSIKVNGEKVTFNATMIKIKDENLTRDFTVVSYAKDAEGVYTYAEAYTVNVAAAAEAFMADEANSAAAKDYIQRKVIDKLA